MKYIDVSEHQGVIDWEQVKGNIDGAILRAGYGSKGTPDKQFSRNAAECNRLGIPCGAYWFSYAKSTEEAKQEAKHLLAAVKPYRMELPLAFDFEYDSVKNAEKHGVEVTKDLATCMVHFFCQTVEAAGYWALNYANPDYLRRYFDVNIPKRYGLWLAQWPKTVDLGAPPRADCVLWQWTSKGNVPGIKTNVDVNEAYKDFAAVIREKGMNNLKPAYSEDDGSVTYEFTQAKPNPPDPRADALKWAQEYYLTDDPDIALALWRYHNTFRQPADPKSVGGVVADD